MNPQDSNKVRLSFEVQSYEADLSSRIKPFYIQNHIQEAAYKGAAFCGSDHETLRDMGVAWVLNRIHLRFSELPRWGDKVDIDTWSRGQQGVLWHRNFLMYDENRCIMEGTSAWTVLDLGSRSLFRGEMPFDVTRHLAEDTLPFCTKIPVPKDLVLDDAGSHVPLFSEIDTNSHVNNCRYTEWAMDSLPFDYLLNHTLKDLEINYYREIHPGSRVDFKLGGKDGRWYFEGSVDGSLCFVVAMSFGQDS